MRKVRSLLSGLVRQLASVRGRSAIVSMVIVGSAFVQRLLTASNLDSGVTAVRELAAELAAGVRGAPAAGS